MDWSNESQGGIVHIPVVGSVLASAAMVLAVGTPVAFGAPGGGPGGPGGPGRDGGRAEHERIVSTWTPEVMASATDRDFERSDDGSFKMKGKAGKPGGGGRGGASPTVTGASWSRGGEVQARTGKVYFMMGGSAYVCSGAVADDGGASAAAVVLTAGHCGYDETNQAFATNFMFIPDFDAYPVLSSAGCAANKYGCWTAAALVVHKGYATAGGFNSQATRYDYTFAVMRTGGKSGTEVLDDAVGGSYPVDTRVADPTPAVNGVLSAFGYPQAAPYNGKDLTYCSGPIIEDKSNAKLTWGMACNMTGGSSGGPWLSAALNLTNGSGGELSSLNSYGYQGKAYMYGPKFDANTAAVWAAAKAQALSGPTGDQIVG